MSLSRLLLAVPLLLATACASPGSAHAGDATVQAPAAAEGQAVAVFAGGCFWCMETAYEGKPGVISVLSGYTAGEIEGPTYKQVSSGATKHAEAVRVLYDPKVISYGELVDIFWHNIDPTQKNGQFCDRGKQYRSALYPANDEERDIANKTRAQAQKTLGKVVVTEIEPLAPFWVAEEYHQDFYKKEPTHYQRYRLGCGRDARLAELWGKAPKH